MPHPLTTGLRTVELACAVYGQQEAVDSEFESAYCTEISRLVSERLGVPVERVREAGPALQQSLPRAGTAWIRTIVELAPDAAVARSAWGSYMLQRGVPPSEEGSPVTLSFEGRATEAVGRTLADAVVSQMPFVPKP
jgi:hypothetical protein